MRGAYKQLIMYLLWDGGVFDGWHPIAADEGPLNLSNKQRDRYMIDQCRDRGLILVSRDREARETAHVDGVHALTPEQYGAEVFTVERARDMFMERMKVAVASYPGRYAPEERAGRVEHANTAFDVYARLWLPPMVHIST